MKLRSILAGVLGALITSESAFALSCARPDLIKTLEAAKVSPKTYHILVGRFTSLTPEAAFNQKSGQTSLEDQFKPKPPRILPTHFEGYALTRSQRSDEVLTRFPVDVEISCVASWCSSVPRSGSEVIAFVEAREGWPPLLKISPCPSTTFQATEEQIQKTRQCLGESCESDVPNWR